MREIESFKLEVNGKEIGTKKFVKEFIGNSLLGQVETLRLKDSGIDAISIEIRYGKSIIQED